MKEKQITVEEYEKLLNKHDWYYMMSEDNAVYLRGCHTLETLKDLSTTTQQHKELFDSYNKKYTELIKGKPSEVFAWAE